MNCENMKKYPMKIKECKMKIKECNKKSNF